jgi:uncharacterized damage-inducible protein DinB
MQVKQWFSRKFDFERSKEVFPGTLERLRGTPARLEELVKSIPTELLRKKIEDKWSIQEQVGHLGDIEELHLGRLDDYRSRLTSLRPADLTNLKTKEANHNSNSLQTLLARFRSARMRLVAGLEGMEDDSLELYSLHPRLQVQMRPVDMALFAAEHDDHHLAKITETYRSLTK